MFEYYGVLLVVVGIAAYKLGFAIGKAEEREAAESKLLHGWWKVDDFKSQNKKFMTCSECLAVIDCNEGFVDENEYDFCPYCGAKMDSEGGVNNG